MSALIIVSYDGTPNDDDALALGRLLARAGGRLGLAYVRHSREYDPRREELAQHDAERRLQHGAEWLGDPTIARHIVVSASTGEGLAQLAAREGAAIIVFGSDYRTAPGRVEPGTSAQYLLEGGPVAVAIAPAGLRTTPDPAAAWVAVAAEGGDPAATQTAETLAAKLGVPIVTEPSADNLGVIVLGSQAGAPEGRVALSGAARYLMENARSPVLVVPRGVPVPFDDA
jgi:nucleotide-binding universal stress UspA family protein